MNIRQIKFALVVVVIIINSYSNAHASLFTKVRDATTHPVVMVEKKADGILSIGGDLPVCGTPRAFQSRIRFISAAQGKTAAAAAEVAAEECQCAIAGTLGSQLRDWVIDFYYPKTGLRVPAETPKTIHYDSKTDTAWFEVALPKSAPNGTAIEEIRYGVTQKDGSIKEMRAASGAFEVVATVAENLAISLPIALAIFSMKRQKEQAGQTVINNKDGQVIYGSNVTDSVTTITRRRTTEALDSSVTLEQVLSKLGRRVETLCSHLSEDEAGRLKRDYKMLRDEANSKTPRSEWLNLSKEGMISAAKTVKEMAGPVMETIKEVYEALHISS